MSSRFRCTGQTSRNSGAEIHPFRWADYITSARSCNCGLSFCWGGDPPFFLLYVNFDTAKCSYRVTTTSSLQVYLPQNWQRGARCLPRGPVKKACFAIDDDSRSSLVATIGSAASDADDGGPGLAASGGPNGLCWMPHR